MSDPKRGNTRLDGPRHNTKDSITQRLHRARLRWERGEIDGYRCETTPQGEKIVVEFNRAEE